MSAKSWTVGRLLGAVVLGMLAWPAVAPAQGLLGHGGCEKECCPPWYKHYFERAPKLCFKKACPKPICDPCTLKNFGYYQTCWHGWPFAPDWSHCAVPPVGAVLPPCCPHKSAVPPMRIEEKLPEGPKAPAESGTLPTPVQGANRPPDWLPPPPASPVRYEPTSEPKGSALEPVLKPVPVTPSSPNWTPPPPPAPAKSAPAFEPIRRTSLEVPAEPDNGGVTQAVAQEPAAPVPPPPAPPTAVTEPVAPARPAVAGGVLPGMRMVNSPRISLDFNAAALTPQQRQEIELWYTRDGRQWTRDAGARLQDNAVVTEVKEEGTYGFSVVQRSADGTGPQPGQAPQMWVEVDWNKPAVQLIDARFNRTAANRQVLLAWTASDRNLAQQPVTLSYGASPDGPWTTFAPSVPNTGRFVWNLPGNVNGPIHVRVEAFDLVGNVGGDHTGQPLHTSTMPQRP